jgi:hypothetical protein
LQHTDYSLHGVYIQGQLQHTDYSLHGVYIQGQLQHTDYSLHGVYIQGYRRLSLGKLREHKIVAVFSVQKYNYWYFKHGLA